MPKKTITIADIVRIFGECEVQDERGIWMPVNKDWKNKKFDIDLDFGQITEQKLADAFEGKGELEVKTERWQGEPTQWKSTENIAIEFRCRGKLSGLSITEAKLWIHMLDDGGGGYIFETEYLKRFIKKKKDDGTLVVKMVGDDKASECAILPMRELFLYKDKRQKELFI